MKTEKNILAAFILNISFSIFELIGGFFTNSVAIMSDAIHDFGDALSIGISFFLERKSKKKPDSKYTYGYRRYSILGAYITSTFLTVGSIIVIITAIKRLFNATIVNYDGMIIFAVFGTITNLLAAFFTREGKSINQKAVNIHMLEDVFGWIIVLIGSILMKFTNINIIDSIMSILVSMFVLFHVFKNFKKILDIFLVKTPNNITIEDVNKKLSKIKGILNIHHIHIWSMDGVNNYATMHVVTNLDNTNKLKDEIKDKMNKLGICHVTIEIEDEDYKCNEVFCNPKIEEKDNHHHH